MLKKNVSYETRWKWYWFIERSTMTHKSIAKTLWKYYLLKICAIQFLKSSSDYEAMEE